MPDEITGGNKRAGTAAMSLTEIGRLFGVSMQSVQYIERKALRKIRRAIEAEARAAGVSPQAWLAGEGEVA